ncbi:hypothetical protein ACUN9V_09610 [Salinicola sp. V024]|uniref:hypothetical protein n=1 Tax=Salinicola sp. V024 TaxID=3459609 RepID=UPI0040449DD2
MKLLEKAKTYDTKTNYILSSVEYDDENIEFYVADRMTASDYEFVYMKGDENGSWMGRLVHRCTRDIDEKGKQARIDLEQCEAFPTPLLSLLCAKINEIQEPLEIAENEDEAKNV